jgi:hypothetical protein
MGQFSYQPRPPGQQSPHPALLDGAGLGTALHQQHPVDFPCNFPSDLSGNLSGDLSGYWWGDWWGDWWGGPLRNLPANRIKSAFQVAPQGGEEAVRRLEFRFGQSHLPAASVDYRLFGHRLLKFTITEKRFTIT